MSKSTRANARDAAGEDPGLAALETALDQLAEKLQIHPLELRLRNIPAQPPEDGVPFTTNGLAQCLTEGATAFGWSTRLAQPRSMRDGLEWIGWGMAGACYGGYRSQAAARASLLIDGTIEMAAATHEIGSGTTTLMAQIAADALQVPLASVRVVLGDSELPGAPVHGASRNAATIGPAVQAAARALAEGIAQMGGIGMARQSIERNGEVLLSVTRRAGPPELCDRDFETLASGLNTIRLPKTRTSATYAFAAHFVEVRVRPELGEFRYRAGRMGALSIGRYGADGRAHACLRPLRGSFTSWLKRPHLRRSTKVARRRVGCCAQSALYRNRDARIGSGCA